MNVQKLKAQMVEAGWNYVLSTTGSGKNYGLLFTKNGEKFYLNRETWQNLPA
jgi:hypothetical protein